MSRSNPTANEPNPAARWFEWNSEHGVVRYYDKDAKKNVTVPLPFKFPLLDELGSVRGWDDASKSGIYSNEVRDTRTDVLVVKAFKGGTLAEGLYKDIKDRVNNRGGRFVANCYIAFKDAGALKIGSLRFKGAALGAWMEFRKDHRGALYNEAIEIVSYTEGQKGRIVYRVPSLTTRSASEETNRAALALDEELQAWMTAYFSRRTNDRTDSADDDSFDEQDGEATPEVYAHTVAPLEADDIPF